MKKLIIAGGSGFLGNACITYFKNRYDKIIVLSRSKKKVDGNVEFVIWNAKTYGSWAKHLNNASVLINMTGRSVDCRYTAKNKKIILDSRVASTKILGEAISRTIFPPKIWLNSSTATIYRYSLDKEMTEQNGEIGKGFSVAVATAWEKAFFQQHTPKTRKVALRTSIVLGSTGGALRPIKRLVKIGLGGKQGKGNQKFSWIHVQDFVRTIEFIIKSEQLKGVLNVVAPMPTTNALLMKQVRKAVGINFGLPTPKFLLEIGAILIRTETELVLKSRNVIPKKLIEAGFVFDYPSLEDAINEAI